MGERQGGDPNPTAPITFQVPQETYGILANLENGRLGNAYSKRLVRVSSDPQKIADSVVAPELDLSGERLYVYMRIKQVNRYVDDSYTFTINPEGTVITLKSSQSGGSGDQKEHELPSAELFMRELQAAQKVQPTLKR